MCDSFCSRYISCLKGKLPLDLSLNEAEEGLRAAVSADTAAEIGANDDDDDDDEDDFYCDEGIPAKRLRTVRKCYKTADASSANKVLTLH